MSTDGWSGREAADIVGITYRQLDYWARTDLIRPSVADAKGSGSRRRYSYRDLIELRMVRSLLDAGQKLEHVRKAFGYLRDRLGDDLASAKLVIDGESVLLVEDDESLIDVVNRGQGVLNLLALDGVKEQVDAGITELRDRRETPGDGARCRGPRCRRPVTLRTSPLDAEHRALGAKLVPFGGWDMPLSYPQGTLAEHRECRAGRRGLRRESPGHRASRRAPTRSSGSRGR